MSDWRASDVPKVPCPGCGDSRSEVLETRPAIERQGIRRRRRCLGCYTVFTTIETIDKSNDSLPVVGPQP